MHIFHSHESKHWKNRKRIGCVQGYTNKTESASFEDDLVQDVLEIITVFSARLYGARSRKNQKLLEALKEAATAI